MKILLINPPSLFPIESCLPKTIERGRGFIPPLGLMAIAAYLRLKTSNEIKILDCQVDKINYENLRQKIENEKPDIIGITAMSFTLIDVIKTIKIAKEANPKIITILGGPHPTIYPEETAKLKNVDFCIIGEGEKPLVDLINNIGSWQELEKIKGLCFLKNGQLVNNGHSEFIQNLDCLPFAARDLVPYKKYYSSISSHYPITIMFTSRGCPYKCLFCDRPALGKAFRARSAKNVVDEMEECKKMGIEEIFIYDDTFGVDRQRVVDICNEIISRKLKIFWDVRTRVNTVDEELLKKMKGAGCERIHYGVESGTEKILTVLRKGITLNLARKAFEMTKKARIEAEGYFMIGSPTETEEDINKTIEFMKEIKPSYVHITILMPFPATDLYKMALEQGAIKEDVWKKFAENPTVDFHPPFWEKELPKEKLFELLKKAYRSFYLRPQYLTNKIFNIKSPIDLFRKLMAGLRIFKI